MSYIPQFIVFKFKKSGIKLPNGKTTHYAQFRNDLQLKKGTIDYETDDIHIYMIDHPLDTSIADEPPIRLFVDGGAVVKLMFNFKREWRELNTEKGVTIGTTKVMLGRRSPDAELVFEKILDLRDPNISLITNNVVVKFFPNEGIWYWLEENAKIPIIEGPKFIEKALDKAPAMLAKAKQGECSLM